MLCIHIFSKSVSLEHKTQHAVITHTNTSNGAKIPTFLGKSWGMLYLPNAPLRWKELIDPQKACAILSLKYVTTTTNIYSETNWHIFYSSLFIRLRSRWLQIFSKHIDLQLMRQLHLGSDHFLHPKKASVNRLGSLSSAVLVSFCRELEHTGNIFCMAPLQAS